MENNDKQLIEQALSFVNENNRIAMKTITQNSVSRSNFYKLSADLPSDIIEDIKDVDTPVVPITPSRDFKGLVDDELPEPKSGDESEDESEDESKDKPEEKPKDKPKNFIEKMFYSMRNNQAHSIYKFLMDTDPEKLMIDNITLQDIINMSPKQRAKLLGVDYKPGARNLPGKILNTDIGRR